MYTRTLYATGDPAKVDGAVEVLSVAGHKLLADQPGFRGLGVFVDRELGKVAVGTWWQDEQSRDASDARLREQRTSMLAPYVTTLATENWEAAVFTRPSRPLAAGAGFRMGRLEFEPSDGDLLVETFKNVVVPKFQTIPGFEGTSLFIDRARGRATVGVLYTDHKALAASRAAQAAVRGEAITKARFTLRSVEEFELAFMAMTEMP